MVKVHTFDDTGEAYDASQWDENISHGDVLVVESERVVGVLVEAWPVALTAEHGTFHTIRDPKTFDWSKVNSVDHARIYDMAESQMTAARIIAEKGF